ncbi:MAG: glycoside hydrolase family 5 protein [Clostridia bacterium]|nr:glycoside hydrolase family 5 protein [Clostridia bacterium]
MKKIIVGIIIFIIIIVLICEFTPVSEVLDNIIYNNYVSDNGWLYVDGTSIKNKRNKNFTLKGVSSHGLQWYSDIITYDNLKNLKESWNINVFRIAMYTSENGYISNKEEIKNKVIEIANNVIDLDMYAIIDWHILRDNDPNTYKEDSKEFFNEISNLYADKPNVIYEICNEPNGNSISWDKHVKPYAEEIIPIIRQNSPKSLIIVGTPTWCQEVNAAADNRLDFDNILYSCHFYAGTHGEDLRKNVEYALSKGAPIIISEWGTTDMTGNGSIYTDKANEWIDFLNKNNLSWINWSFSNKSEGSAIILPTYTLINEETGLSNDFNDYLTDSGKYVKNLLKK